MLKQTVWATLSVLDLVQRPAELTHDTTPLPSMATALKVKKPAKPRKKHVCTWTDQEVWGAVIAALLFGIFIGFCL
jgi:hypothetical protein